MSKNLLFLMVFAGGMAAAIQPSINATLARRTGVLESLLVSFTVGALILLATLLASGKASFQGLQQAAWWEFTGGAFGVFLVLAITIGVPRIGTSTAVAITIAAQLLTGLVLDHFGAFGFNATAINLRGAIGGILLIVGTIMISNR
jgi:transporter family-2 protein